MSEWQRPGRCESTSCLETMQVWNGKIFLRNSTAPSKIVTFTPEEMDTFVRAVKRGEYDSYIL